eukprot:gene42916-52440_t
MPLKSISLLKRSVLWALLICGITGPAVGWGWRGSRGFSAIPARMSVMNGLSSRNHVSALYMAKGFTEEEDNKLLVALRECIAKKQKVSWDAVSALVGQKTAMQCCNRWNKISTRHPDIASQRDLFMRTEFSLEEDTALVQAVEAFIGTKKKVCWVEVAKKVGTRSNLQCQDRFKYLMKVKSPPVDISRAIAARKELFRDYETWQEEEDARLLEMMRNSPPLRNGGISWTPVAEYVGSRSAAQ